jgi:hypothetical protein
VVKMQRRVRNGLVVTGVTFVTGAMIFASSYEGSREVTPTYETTYEAATVSPYSGPTPTHVVILEEPDISEVINILKNGINTYYRNPNFGTDYVQTFMDIAKRKSGIRPNLPDSDELLHKYLMENGYGLIVKMNEKGADFTLVRAKKIETVGTTVGFTDIIYYDNQIVGSRYKPNENVEAIVGNGNTIFIDDDNTNLDAHRMWTEYERLMAMNGNRDIVRIERTSPLSIEVGEEFLKKLPQGWKLEAFSEIYLNSKNEEDFQRHVEDVDNKLAEEFELERLRHRDKDFTREESTYNATMAQTKKAAGIGMSKVALAEMVEFIGGSYEYPSAAKKAIECMINTVVGNDHIKRSELNSNPDIAILEAMEELGKLSDNLILETAGICMDRKNEIYPF